MTANRPRLAFIVNGTEASAASERAIAFATRLSDTFDIVCLHRTAGRACSVREIFTGLQRFRPAFCVVFDHAAAGVAAAFAYRCLAGVPYLVDTGDDIVALGKALGRGPVSMLATRFLDALAARSAAGFIVRGSVHKELLTKRGLHATFIPDGVSVARFAPPHGECLRPPGPNQPLSIGIVGSSVWEPRRRICYGLELVELLALLRDRCPWPVRGILIGDGTGLPYLRDRCQKLGVVGQMEFSGRVPYDELPRRLHQFHICLSTQTNDAVGRVRTTGKLPLYLAAGRLVLASRVGEAARVLPPEMLVEYAGDHDRTYPAKLAERVRELIAIGTDFSYRPDSVKLALQYFEYDILVPRLAYAVQAVLSKFRLATSSKDE